VCPVDARDRRYRSVVFTAPYRFAPYARDDGLPPRPAAAKFRAARARVPLSVAPLPGTSRRTRMCACARVRVAVGGGGGGLS
jgi:hypothetical protein